LNIGDFLVYPLTFRFQPPLRQSPRAGG